MDLELNPNDLLKLICFLRDNLPLFRLQYTASWSDVGWAIERGLYMSMEVYYSFDGNIGLHHENRQFQLQPEYIVLMDNSLKNSCDNGKFRIYGFSYFIDHEKDPDGTKNKAYQSLLSHVVAKPMCSDPSSARLIADIEKDFYFNAKEYETSGFCAIIQVLLGAYRILCNNTSSGKAYINSKSRKIVNKIAEHLINHPESNEKLEAIARQFGLNHRYINRMFKNIYGMPIQKYHCIAKVKQAKRMLSTTNMTMTEIAMALNFANSQYFSYVFKKETGTTPNEFRKLTRGIYNN